MSDYDYGEIWEELNDEQSREILAHHRRTSTSVNNNPVIPAIKNLFHHLSASGSSSTTTATTTTTSRTSPTASSTCPPLLSDNRGGDNDDDHRGGGGNTLSEFGLPKWSPMEIFESTSSRTDGGGVSSDPLLQSSPTSTEPSSSAPKKFVFLDKFRLPSTDKSSSWGVVSNLDLFFTTMYNYYYHRGFTSYVGKGLIELLSLFTTLLISIILFAYLDWSALLLCRDEHSCRPNLTDYLLTTTLVSTLPTTPFAIVIAAYLALFSLYGLYSTIRFVATVRDALRARDWYENKLGITPAALEGGGVQWDDVVGRLSEAQESGEWRVCIHGEKVDALVVAMRVMRRENFLVGLFNLNLIDLRLPFTERKMFFSKSLEWSLYVCVLGYMWNKQFKIRPQFYMDPSGLKRRLVLCGVAQLIFMPFLLLFMVLYFFLVNVHEFRSRKEYMGPRGWSHLAKWTFREFNELPHTFERRLSPSYPAAEAYYKLFRPTTVLTLLGRSIMFLTSSLLAVLLGFAAANDAILLHVKIGPWNLLWYVGILGVLFSVGKGLVPDAAAPSASTSPQAIHQMQPHRDHYKEMNDALAKVCLSTHYQPQLWKNGAWKAAVQAQFKTMYMSKSMLFLWELTSVVLAPFLLCFTLPRCAEDICAFVRQTKVTVPGVGDVCAFSCFDFEEWRDENWDEDSVDGEDDDEQQQQQNNKPRTTRTRTKQGKMEKSFFNFKAAHPSWKCHQSGQNLVDRLETFRKEREDVWARERQLYVEAAAKQLDTLRVIEQQQLQQRNEQKPSYNDDGKPTPSLPIRESYIDTKINHQQKQQQHQPPPSTWARERQLYVEAAAKQLDTLRELEKQQQQQQQSDEQQLSYDNDKTTPSPPIHESYIDTKINHQPPSSSSITNPLSPSTINPSPPPPPQPPLSTSSLAASHALMSVLHYADLNLSTELQRLLNQSKLVDNLSSSALLDFEPGSLLGASCLANNNNMNATMLSSTMLLAGAHNNHRLGRTMSSTLVNDSVLAADGMTMTLTEGQYRWLERYHESMMKSSSRRDGSNDLGQTDVVRGGGGSRWRRRGDGGGGGGGGMAKSSFV